ncbi:MAG: transketolase, partial [Spirochaetaceae bacterium]|nr:transketolase [Spirochaetaceae bacterium]
APLGDDEIAKAKVALGLSADAKFWVAPEAYAFYETRRKTLAAARAAWLKEYAAWKAEEPALAAELADYLAGKARAALDLPSFTKGDKIATRAASGKCIAAVAKAWPNLIGGSADLTSPNVTSMPDTAPYSAADRKGRYIHYGIREHAMAGIANGLSQHGGFRVFVATFLVFSDYLKPSLRLAALMKQPVVYVLTHDSIMVGEDGPTHQPIEHLAAIRAIPNVRLFRPGDAEETAVAWRMAMERKDGPTVLVLSRNNLTVQEKDDPEWPYTMGLGAYVVKNTPKAPDVVVAATGSELGMAVEAAAKVPGKAVRVVSVPCRELFYAQPAPVRDAMFPPGCRVVVAEAGVAMGWERIAKFQDIFCIERFGESGPADKVAAHLGFTADALAALIAK